MKSWKTTAAGIAALLAVIATAIAAHLDGDASTTAEWGAVVTAVFVALGFVASRDNSKTSEDVGAGSNDS
tara:strand:+ start:1039 stop:1248 length:210 start_codon:yes stop_codon:yes gene_type:complete